MQSGGKYEVNEKQILKALNEHALLQKTVLRVSNVP